MYKPASKRPMVSETISLNSSSLSSYSSQMKVLLSMALGFMALIFFIRKVLAITALKKPTTLQQYEQLPPGPTPWPIVGCIPSMLRNRPTFRWIHRLMKELNTDIACVRLGSIHVISITCPKIAQEVVRKQDAIFASRPKSFAAETFSGGYLTTAITPYGDQFKKMRKILTNEIVCTRRHAWLHDKRAKELDHLIKSIYHMSTSKENNRPIDLRLVTRLYSADVIKSLIFNKRYLGKSPAASSTDAVLLGFDEDEAHVEALFQALGSLHNFCISDYLPCLLGLDNGGDEKIIKKADSTINRLHDPIIDERFQEWRLGEKKEVEDLLDVLITLKDDDGKPLLTPEEVKSQCREMIMASVDNSSNAVEWIMAEMQNNPYVLEKAMEELDSVVGKEKLVQETDIRKLNYLKACIREAFRLHPIAAFNLTHVAMSDTVVAGQYFIPKGSHVLLSRMGLGRDPKTWEEPLKFKPERHLVGISSSTEVALTEPDCRFISFSSGRRGCVGVALGSVMTVMLLASLLQAFAWSKPDGVCSINLDEGENDMLIAEPLMLQAKPRLPKDLYNQH